MFDRMCSVKRRGRALGIFAVIAALIATGCATTRPSTSAASHPMDADAASTARGWQLESVVIVSRHGVRAPTRTKPPLARLSPKQWPQWPVQPGELTARGADLVEQMGHYYGEWLRERRVLPQSSCPSPNAVYAWADVNQRTRLTGDRLLAGIAPGCALQASHQPALDSDDPVFHASESGACKLDPQTARAAIEARLGAAGFSGLTKTYAASLTRLDDVLDFQASPLCADGIARVPSGACRFSALPNRVSIDDQGRHMRLDGAVGIASTVSEVFLLEYGQGLPADQVAWGRVRDEADWRALLATHNAQFDLMAKTSYLAQRKGTPMLADIAAALDPDRHAARLTSHSPAGNRVYILASHDTNLANLAGMLKLAWRLPEQPDNTPPGGALVFSRWRDPVGGERYVTVEMVYQTLAQLRDVSALSLARPPRRIALAVPGCADPTHGDACRLRDLERVMSDALAPDCLTTH